MPSREGIAAIRKRRLRSQNCAHLPKCTDKLARGRVGAKWKWNTNTKEGVREGTLKFKKETRQL